MRRELASLDGSNRPETVVRNGPDCL